MEYKARQSLWLQGTLIHKRKFDRKLHVGLLSNGQYVRLKVREFERGIEQISSYPWFSDVVHFPRV